MAISPAITDLIDCAANCRLGVVFYRKCVTRKKLMPRLVEPYSFVEGSQDLMVRCYQLEHGGSPDEAGWRFFMAHKIDSVEKTDIPFKPRRKISLPTAELAMEFEPNIHWDSDGRRVYRDFVGDALADGALDAGEKFDLEGIKQKYKLDSDAIRFIHASVYHRCLGAVLQDGFFSQDEVVQIKFLHTAMQSLGLAVGD